MADEKEDGASATFGCVLLFGAGFLQAWVIMLLWRWFVAPLGVVAITYWQAMGWALLASLMTRKLGKSSATVLEMGVEAMLVSLSSLGIGAVVHGLAR